MTKTTNIATLARTGTKRKTSSGFCIRYDIKSDKAFLLQGDNEVYIPMKRYKGHFDDNNNYVIDAVLGTW